MLTKTAKARRSAKVVSCETRLEEAARAGAVLFAFDSAELLEDAVTTLDALAATARSCGKLRVTIEGHTDATGEIDYNQGLSERRAENVANYLISAGVTSNRVQFIGYGERRPVASNTRGCTGWIAARLWSIPRRPRASMRSNSRPTPHRRSPPSGA